MYPYALADPLTNFSLKRVPSTSQTFWLPDTPQSLKVDSSKNILVDQVSKANSYNKINLLSLCNFVNFGFFAQVRNLILFDLKTLQIIALME